MTNPEQSLDAALREARDQALEEAIKVVLGEAWAWRIVNREREDEALRIVARRIRALKSQEPQ